MKELTLRLADDGAMQWESKGFASDLEALGMLQAAQHIILLRLYPETALFPPVSVETKVKR